MRANKSLQVHLHFVSPPCIGTWDVCLFITRENVLLGTFVNMIPIAVQETILPITVTICFASLGCLLFQPLLENFITFFRAAITVNLLMMESSALVPTADSIYVIGKVYIISLYSVMLFIILNYFIVLLNEAYSAQKQKRKKVWDISLSHCSQNCAYLTTE